MIGANEEGKMEMDLSGVLLNNNDISFNKERLSVSDIICEAIKDFYEAIINGKEDDDIKALI